VLSGAADPARAALAMASLDKHLIRRKDGIALLFTPPFDKTLHDPGYIKGYPPGLRENGGQYSHAAMWAILAYVKLRRGMRTASNQSRPAVRCMPCSTASLLTATRKAFACRWMLDRIRCR
jgi:cellobiose phosphorylase